MKPGHNTKWCRQAWEEHCYKRGLPRSTFSVTPPGPIQPGTTLRVWQRQGYGYTARQQHLVDPISEQSPACCHHAVLLRVVQTARPESLQFRLEGRRAADTARRARKEGRR